MSLPPGFLDELRTRTSLSQVVGRKVLWDNRKSNQGKGDMWAPCPFHQEKSASFHVDDRKGYYYCFGCHAKGDAISFVRETENVGFMEAVEILAQEAGMPMPKRDPQAQQKADRRTELAEVMEAAAGFFRLQLRTGQGGAARDYLARRGMSEATQERFGIGFAPDGWQNLWDHLQGKGVPAELIQAAGLVRESTKGGKPYDVFRNRIMFPIRDARGRCIAFGGRAMDPNDNAKYLNSPETELFDKGRNLYNHGPAREAAGKGLPLIVAEGYMDVIALVEAGFGAAVAPLGTAVTENQLQLLWRISDEPIVALDGDAAGLRAAYRVIDLALPLMESGKSLRFALMPEGKDPDDLIRAEGAKGVQAVLHRALPMVQLLWKRETEGKVFDSPERKAALDKALRETILQIKDPSLRSHYGQEIKDLRWQLFRARPSGTGPRSRRDWKAPPPATDSAKLSLLVAAGAEGQDRLREAVILAALLSTPQIIAEFDTQVEVMTCSDPVHAALRDLLLRSDGSDPAALRAEAENRIGAEALESLFAARHVAITPCVRNPSDVDLARQTVAEELAKLDARRGLLAEIAEASEDLDGLADEALTWRLAQAAQAMTLAERAQQVDSAEYDTGPNGARMDKDERSAFAALLEKIESPKSGS
ncbi:DNA primase [Thalassococcus profundi]|uniref:DNA primase n=1 Tax=Thalassococcus profundi TaxID=2282382 RepID=A0A369TM74_9RHOB|nr:DNA primase [Thalassococcus profundi]RDD66399.1 DNA primase [Thalassococcus profundi]